MLTVDARSVTGFIRLSRASHNVGVAPDRLSCSMVACIKSFTPAVEQDCILLAVESEIAVCMLAFVITCCVEGKLPAVATVLMPGRQPVTALQHRWSSSALANCLQNMSGCE